MKNILWIIFSIWFLSAKAQKGIVYVKDSTRYDSSFIKSLKDYIEPIRLIDTIIIVSNDTFLFPQDLILNKVILFKGKTNSKYYSLVLTRINETTIKYRYTESGIKHKSLLHETGEAILFPTFFLSMETDVDDITDETYSCFEYCKNEKDSFCIRVGVDAKGHMRARVNYLFEDVSPNGKTYTIYSPLLTSE
jgi:hypothetical protein